MLLDKDLVITHMVSPEGESLELMEEIDPKGKNVEAWMLELEEKMRLTVRKWMTSLPDLELDETGYSSRNRKPASKMFKENSGRT